jgi:hypothetical protein
MFQCSLLSTISGQLQSSESIRWRFKKNEEEEGGGGDVGIHTAAAGFTFLVPRISTEKRPFWVSPTMGEPKILTYTSLPYATFDQSNPRPQHSAPRPGCRYRNTTETFGLYRLATGLGRLADMFYKCCRFVAK